MSKRRLKEILSDIDELIKAGYGSYNELEQKTYREIADIQVMRISKQQEEDLKKSLQ